MQQGHRQSCMRACIGSFKHLHTGKHIHTRNEPQRNLTRHWTQMCSPSAGCCPAPPHHSRLSGPPQSKTEHLLRHWMPEPVPSAALHSSSQTGNHNKPYSTSGGGGREEAIRGRRLRHCQATPASQQAQGIIHLAQCYCSSLTMRRSEVRIPM